MLSGLVSLCVPLILDKSSSSNGSTPVSLKSLSEDLVGFLPKTLRGCATEVSSTDLNVVPPLPKLVVVRSAELEVGDILDNSNVDNPSEVMNRSRNVESLTLDSVLLPVLKAELEFRNLLVCFDVVLGEGVPTIFVNAP